jgi:hypothetical protein
MNIPCHVIESHSFLYVEVPKAGCSSIKASLAPWKKGAAWQGTSTDDMHEWFGYTNVSGIPELLSRFETCWREYYKFTVVRHPITRFESLFYNKIRNSYKDTINEYIHSRFMKDEWWGNAHCAPQTTLIGMDISRYDFVGRLEAIPLVERQLSSLFENISIPHLNSRPVNAGYTPLSDTSLARLKEAYKDDFDVLGYIV